MRRSVNHDKSDGLCGTLFPPDTDWKCPTVFPNLSGEKILGLDIETKDPNLRDRGPGFIRGDAQVVGISVSTLDKSWYFPVGHLGGGNHANPDGVFSFIRDLVRVEDRYIVGANLQYELEGLDSRGIVVSSRLLDVQVAEALIDEEARNMALDKLCHKYLGGGKDETLLKSAASAYGLTDVKGNLWKLPAHYVGPYAEFDAHCVLKIFSEQKKTLEIENLLPIFELESKILPILWKMRKQGVPIDMEKATALSKDLAEKQAGMQLALSKEIGWFIDVWSPIHLQRLCEQRKINYPRTDKGNPSFTGDWLDNFSDPILNRLAEVRDIDRMRKTFIDDWIFGNEVKGRIHPQWKQLASEDGGTRTGRMACANPNAQQVPAGKFRSTGKVNEIGRAIRSCFISDTGNWAKFDYKQQEPRILTHFANLCNFTGAPLAAMAYNTNKKMDFYDFIVESAGIDRRPAKDMFLGLSYGMGLTKLAVKLGKTKDEAQRILDDFNTKVPFIKEIAESCERNAQNRGYVKTLLGRRRHFNKWEPADGYRRRTEKGEVILPCSLEEAQRRWPRTRLVRADTRKALNALIQGSAADMLKAALLKVYEEKKIIPYLCVHDELDLGVNSLEHAQECQEIVENCVEMTVPIYCDMDYGKHWK